MFAKYEKEIINKYLGIPYKHRGRTLKGLDCWGLIKLVYQGLGFDLWDIQEYDEKWSFQDKNHFIENYHKQWIKVNTPRLFDVVLFLNSKGIAHHAGIILNQNRFIHSCKAGVVISRFSDFKWSKRIQGFYRLKQMQ